MSDPRRSESPATTGTGPAARDVAVKPVYLPRWYRIRCESLQRRRRNKRLVHVLGSATLIAAGLSGWLVGALPSALQPPFVQDGTGWLIETAERSRAALSKWTSSHQGGRETQPVAKATAIALPSVGSALVAEPQRVERLAAELASARVELQAANARAQQQSTRRSEPDRRGFEQERARAEALAVELASARAELEEAKARTSTVEKAQAEIARASEQDKQALKQEHARANAFAHELASARAELKAATARASTAAAAQEQTTQVSEQDKRALEQERAKAASFARELASVRAELDAAKARTSAVAQQQIETAHAFEQEKRSLEQERARAEALARELASTRAELEAAKERTSAVAAARVIADQPPEHNERALEQASDRELAESAQASTKAETGTQTHTTGVSEQEKRALGQERAGTEAAGQLHPAQHSTTPATGGDGGRSAATDRMIERAQKLIALADVNGARLLLERSLALGDERAAFPLAQTYDPRVLAERGLRGVQGDAAKARTLYLRAQIASREGD